MESKLKMEAVPKRVQHYHHSQAIAGASCPNKEMKQGYFYVVVCPFKMRADILNPQSRFDGHSYLLSVVITDEVEVKTPRCVR